MTHLPNNNLTHLYKRTKQAFEEFDFKTRHQLKKNQIGLCSPNVDSTFPSRNQTHLQIVSERS
jgi:hypothetical protein